MWGVTVAKGELSVSLIPLVFPNNVDWFEI